MTNALFYCVTLRTALQLTVMAKKNVDLSKVVRQHLEMDVFFTGDFGIKTEYSETQDADLEHESGPDGTGNMETAKGLKEIADQVNNCCQCGLGQSRTNAVPGEGSPNARIAFVGEAPGADEDRQGKPFVGRAGKLLDKIIKAMGMRREDVYICNILKCRPPDNRDPKPDEIIKCLPYLQQQLETIKPEIIIALGAHAARTLLESNKPIGQLRGKFHEYYPSMITKPIKLMATYHPAYLLRNYSQDNRRKVWEDMQKVLSELGLEMPSTRS